MAAPVVPVGEEEEEGLPRSREPATRRIRRLRFRLLRWNRESWAWGLCSPFPIINLPFLLSSSLFPTIPVFYPSFLLSSGIGSSDLGGTSRRTSISFTSQSFPYSSSTCAPLLALSRKGLSFFRTRQLAFHAVFPTRWPLVLKVDWLILFEKSYNVLQTYPGYGTSRFRFPS